MLTLIGNTNFLSVPENPFILVVIAVSVRADNTVGFWLSDTDIKNGWPLIVDLSDECPLGAGAKVFARSDPDQPA